MQSVSTRPRRIPCQVRGERRVAELLEAAEAVIAEAGYEAATMSKIADRADEISDASKEFAANARKALNIAPKEEPKAEQPAPAAAKPAAKKRAPRKTAAKTPKN